MPIELHRIASLSASSFHAAVAIHDRCVLADTTLAEAPSAPV